jgi:hypothetical protein
MPIIDLVSKRVIKHCYYVQGNPNNPKIYQDCIREAIKDKDLILFHSGQDNEYTNNTIKALFKNNNIFQSLCDETQSYQNGLVEGFFSQVSNRLSLRKLLDKQLSHQQLKDKVNEFIINYNKK